MQITRICFATPTNFWRLLTQNLKFFLRDAHRKFNCKRTLKVKFWKFDLKIQSSPSLDVNYLECSCEIFKKKTLRMVSVFWYIHFCLFSACYIRKKATLTNLLFERLLTQNFQPWKRSSRRWKNSFSGTLESQSHKRAPEI